MPPGSLSAHPLCAPSPYALYARRASAARARWCPRPSEAGRPVGVRVRVSAGVRVRARARVGVHLGVRARVRVTNLVKLEHEAAVLGLVGRLLLVRLIGLGGGFAKLNASTGQASTEVVLTPSIIVGLCFLAVNCLLVVVSGLVVNSGHIPKGYGYVALGLYIIYVFTSIALQFYDPDQEE